jgi:lysophospholipase L1-like esterase
LANRTLLGAAVVLVLVALVLRVTATAAEDSITVYLIGDSTMADRSDPETNPGRGWGQMLHAYFGEGVIVENHSKSGRSSKSFRDEGLWDPILKTMQAGDYVFIQFGHNDQKDQDPKRFTNPNTGFRQNLAHYVMETREKGAHPGMMSSIVRRRFNDEGVLLDTHGVYPTIARSVARDMDVPFVDMQLLTEELVLTSGVEGSKALFVWVKPGEYAMYPKCSQDNSHLSMEGGRLVAGLAAAELRRMGHPLALHLKK